MQVQNLTSQSRLCPSLGENLEAFEVREVSDGFVRCEECRCILSGEAVAPSPEVSSESKATEAE